MDNDRSKTPERTPTNTLPYILLFAILFLVALGVLTWVLDVYNKAHQCSQYPNIWCSDNWTCNNSCGGGITGGYTVNSCFESVQPTGLASCLYGPNSPTATICLNVPTTGPTVGGTGLACDCPTGMTDPSVMNCFNGCAFDLNSVGQPQVCCCTDINNPSCAVAPNPNGSGVIGIGICAPT